jgi:hypothetical protein
MSERDIPRRERAYLGGYFKELRLATMRGFPPEQLLKLLDIAEKLLPKVFSLKAEQSKWRKTINFDRKSVQSCLQMNGDGMESDTESL